MSGPVERWLETFMCKHYANVFDSFGFKTLQSVCQLQPHQLQAMGVAQNHCDLILENVCVLRQTMSVGVAKHSTNQSYGDNPVNPASSALRSVAMTTNYPQSHGPTHALQDDYTYGSNSNQNNPNSVYPKQYEEPMSDMTRRGYGRYSEQNQAMAMQQQQHHQQQHQQQQMFPPGSNYVHHHQQYGTQQYFSPNQQNSAFYNSGNPQNSHHQQQQQQQPQPQQHHFSRQQMVHNVNPQAVADNILQMASSYPSSQTVQVPLNKNRVAPYHVPQPSHNYSMPNQTSQNMMAMNQQRIYSNSMNAGPQQQPSRTSPISPMPLQSPVSHHSSQSVPSPSSMHSPLRSPAQSPGGGMRSPCGVQPMASPHQSMRSPSHGHVHHSQHQQPVNSSPQRMSNMRSPVQTHYSPNHGGSHTTSPYHTTNIGVQSPTNHYSPPAPPVSYINTESTKDKVSYPQSDPVNPLQSLQKLVMLPESRVVDPKSVVNDACSSPQINDNSKNCDSSAEWLNKDCSCSAGSTNQSSPAETRPLSSCLDGKNCDETKNSDSVSEKVSLVNENTMIESKTADKTINLNKDTSHTLLNGVPEDHLKTSIETKQKLSPPKKMLLNAYNESLQDKVEEKVNDLEASKTNVRHEDQNVKDSSRSDKIIPKQPDNETSAKTNCPELLTTDSTILENSTHKLDNKVTEDCKIKSSVVGLSPVDELGSQKPSDTTSINCSMKNLSGDKLDDKVSLGSEFECSMEPSVDKLKSKVPSDSKFECCEGPAVDDASILLKNNSSLKQSDSESIVNDQKVTRPVKSPVDTKSEESEEELHVRKDTVNTYSRVKLTTSSSSVEKMRNNSDSENNDNGKIVCDESDDEDFSFTIEEEEESEGSSEVHSEVEENYKLEEDDLLNDEEDINELRNKLHAFSQSTLENQSKVEMKTEFKSECDLPSDLESVIKVLSPNRNGKQNPRNTPPILKREDIPSQTSTTLIVKDEVLKRKRNSDRVLPVKKPKVESESEPEVVEITDSSDDEKPLIDLKLPSTSTPTLKHQIKKPSSPIKNSDISLILKSEPIPRSSNKKTIKTKSVTNSFRNNKCKKLGKNHKKKNQTQDSKEHFKDMNFGKTLSLMKNKKKSEQGQNVSPFVRLVGSKSEPFSVTVYNVHPNEEEDTKQKKNKGPVSSTIQISNLPSDKSIMLPHSQTITEGNWVCALCGKRSSYKFLGDLFGPYYIDCHIPLVKKQLENDNKAKIPKIVPERKRRKSKDRHSLDSDTKPNEVWVHENCTLWSDGVFLVGSKIYGLEEAIKVASSSVCSICKENGAMIGCLHKGCEQKFHFMCAAESKCYLDEDNFSLLCVQHKGKRKKDLDSSKSKA